MKILYVSTLKRHISPNQFASRERIIYQLGSEMVKRGHEVSILGTADSIVPGATIIPVIEKGWINLPPPENPFIRDVGTLLMQARQLEKIHKNYDIIHNHTTPDFFPSVLDKHLERPLVTTLHAVGEPYVDDVLEQFPNTYYIALSQAYKNLLPKSHIYDVIYNGINTDLYAYNEKKDDYLLWVGRLSPAKDASGAYMDPKGARWAIELAEKTNSRLLMSGTVHSMDFFEKDIKPHLNEKIQWVGTPTLEQSVPVEKIVDLMQHAKAFLMTVNQEEPFGLVMAEAMSCGTPVIAWKRGSVPEVIVQGKTGYYVEPADGIDGLIKALHEIKSVLPQDCRKHVEKHYSLQIMVSSYEKLYDRIITSRA